MRINSQIFKNNSSFIKNTKRLPKKKPTSLTALFQGDGTMPTGSMNTKNYNQIKKTQPHTPTLEKTTTMDSQQNKDFFFNFFEYSLLCIKDGYVSSDSSFKALRAIKNCKKGVVLYGGTGTGKTLILELIMRLIHPQDPKRFIKAYCLDQIIEFNTTGHDIFMKNRDKNVWFDDLGAEGKGYYYGDKFEVFERMIQIRYDLFRNGILTHFTTNLTPTEIKVRYGERTWSRLSEMCEHIIFDGEDKRTKDNFIRFVPVHHKPIKTKEELEWEENYNKMREESRNRPYENKTGEGIGQQVKKQIEALLNKKQ